MWRLNRMEKISSKVIGNTRNMGIEKGGTETHWRNENKNAPGTFIQKIICL